MPPKLLEDDEPEQTETDANEDEILDDEPEEVVEDPETGSDPEGEEAEADDGETVETDDGEEVEVEEVELPGEDDDEPEAAEGSLGGGTTFGVPNKVLLVVGIGAVLVTGYLLYVRSKANATTHDYTTEEATEEVEEELSEEPEEPKIERDDRDPLAADGEAFGYLFGGEE